MESDHGDYIGQWHMWIFNNANESVLNLKWINGNSGYNYGDATRGFGFNVKSFDGSFYLEFDPKDSATSNIWLFYPAKRFPFNDVFNGLSVTGNGAGCNEVLGWFYIHEISINSDGLIEKLAIDFVQACEKSTTSAFYGSIRINSNIASNCTTTNCDAVKKLFPESDAAKNSLSKNPSYQQENAENIQRASAEIKEYEAIVAKMKQSYGLFYNVCLKKSIEANEYSEEADFFGQNDYVNINACGTKYVLIMQKLNIFLEKQFGPFSNQDSDSQVALTGEQVAEIQKIQKELRAKIKALEKFGKKKLAPEFQVLVSALIYIYSIQDVALKYFVLENQ